jgi:hypothetical protein
MTQEHPITPPPELVEQWRTAPEYASALEKLTMVTMTDRRLQEIASQAARWGADQELEACCHLLRQQGFDVVDDLRATRRPKPPSLKEQALELVDRLEKAESPWVVMSELATIRRALEQLDD